MNEEKKSGIIIRNGILYSGGGSGGTGLEIIEITQEEYDALPEEEKNRDDVIYDIIDGDYELTAKDMFFDYSGTNLTKDNAEDAIKEINDKVTTLNNTMPKLENVDVTSDYGTISVKNCFKYGNVCSLSFVFTVTKNANAWSNVLQIVGATSKQFSHVIGVKPGTYNQFIEFQIGGSVLQNAVAISANEVYRISATFICD